MDEQVRGLAIAHAGRKSEAGDLQRAQALRLPRVRTQMRADEQHRMVLQIAPDARQVRAHIDAMLAQMIGGPDPGAHQHRGCLDRAGAEDDFACAEFALLAVDGRGHAARALSVEQQLRNIRAGRDRQVRPRAHRRIEIADRRRGATRRRVAHRQRTVAVAEIAVHVGDKRHLPRLRECVSRARDRRPVLLASRGGPASARLRRAVRR